MKTTEMLSNWLANTFRGIELSPNEQSGLDTIYERMLHEETALSLAAELLRAIDGLEDQARDAWYVHHLLKEELNRL